MPELGLTRLPDWIVVAQEAWDDMERRNQLLVRALAGRNPGTRFLFAERPLRPREVRDWRPSRPREVSPGVWAVRPVRPLPDSLSAEHSDRFEAAQIRRAARAIGLQQPMVWTQDPRCATLIDRLGAAGLVYDLTDDWAAFESDEGRRSLVQERIEALGRRADVVFACSRSLEEGARRWHPGVRFLPNAVEPPREACPEPADLTHLPRPRLAYAGTLHSSRLDADLLAQCAERRPGWSFVLLGPDQLEPSDRRRLLGLPNIYHLGSRPHAAVRSYLEHVDIGLLPHRVDDFTRSLDPLKLYEYLGAGRPVIATPAGNAPELADHVEVAATADEIVAHAERLLASPGDPTARRAAVAGATWEARAAEVEAALGVGRPAPPTVEVSAVIVSFNTREMLDRCLTALAGQRGVSVQTIVVDNGSTDGSIELVRDRYPKAELIELGENRGFGPANNIAFGRCRGRYVLLLNSDAFLHDGALNELIAAAERHPASAAIGPRLLNPDGSLQRSAWPFPTAGRLLLEAFLVHRPLRRAGLLEDLGTFEHDTERRVDFLIGACLLLRSGALREVGGFDEDFWLYGEEADLQRRMADRGWQTVLAPAAEVTHVGGASSQSSLGRLRHFYAGQLHFLAKHGGRAAVPVGRAALLAGSVLRGRRATARVALGR